MESLETGSLFVYKNERQVENMSYKITNAISSNRVPAWGNKKKYIAVHYLGVVGQNHDLASDGCGAHFYIYWDGTIYQRCSLDAVPWAVGTAGYYAQKHPEANNYNTISIEMCCKCDGNAASANDPTWYFTQETQEACVWLVKQLMGQLGIAADHVLRHYDIVNKVCPGTVMCTTTTIIPVGRGMSSRKKVAGIRRHSSGNHETMVPCPQDLEERQQPDRGI